MEPSWFDFLKVLLPVLATQGLGFFIAIYMFKRNEDLKSKRAILYTFMGSRHAMGANEYISAINSIDIVFYKDLLVRNSAQKFNATLSSPSFNTPNGQFVAEEARVDLIMSIVKHMKLDKNINRADVMRAYFPEIVDLRASVDYMDLLVKRDKLKREIDEMESKKESKNS